MVKFIGRARGFPYDYRSFDKVSPFVKPLVEGLPETDFLYHRSQVRLNIIRDDVRSYTNRSKTLLSSSLFRCALNRVSRAFELPKPVKLIHFNDVCRKTDLDIWSASPGLPYKHMGYKTKADVRANHHLLNNMRWMWHKVKVEEPVDFPDCCAFIRKHLAVEGENKTRAVWGYPMAMTLGEAIFALPLIREYSKVRGRYPIAYGYETALGGTSAIMKRFSGLKSIFAMDYSGFDRSVPAWLIECAFHILERNMNFLEYEDRGVSNVQGVLNQWEYIKYYFINTPIQLSNGERYLKASGVASGSYFTQLIDSICNALIIEYICLRLGVRLIDYIVFGDDSLFSAPGLKLSDFRRVLKDEFDMYVNFTKSACSDNICDLEFLGYQLTNGLPHKTFSRWICMAAFPEHPDSSGIQAASRVLGLYYANLGVNARFHRMAKCYLKVASEVYRGMELELSRDMRKMLVMWGHDVKAMDFTKLPTRLEFRIRNLMIR